MDYDDLEFPEDYDPFAPAVSDNKTTTATKATTTNQTTNDKNKKNDTEVKKKVQKLKLDENLLLSSKGLIRIKYETPFIKFKGRGHEAEDLAKLMRYYQIWANNLYPRLRFQDFVSKVVKVTPKKRCRVSLSEWQEEYKDKRRERQKGKGDVEEGFSGMSLDDNAEKNIEELNAEIFGGGTGTGGGTSSENREASTSGRSATEQERNNQTRDRTIIGLDDDDTSMEDDSSDDDDQPLFVRPRPMPQEEEEADPSEIEKRRKQKNSRADALAALIARRGKNL